MFNVCFCARYRACPKESLLKAVTQIFKYLKGTIPLGLWCLKTLILILKAIPMQILSGANGCEKQ